MGIYKQKVFGNHSQDRIFIWLGIHLSLYILSPLQLCKGDSFNRHFKLNFESRIESHVCHCICEWRIIVRICFVSISTWSLILCNYYKYTRNCCAFLTCILFWCRCDVTLCDYRFRLLKVLINEHKVD